MHYDTCAFCGEKDRLSGLNAGKQYFGSSELGANFAVRKRREEEEWQIMRKF